jgi:hypothetical protein
MNVMSVTHILSEDRTLLIFDRDLLLEDIKFVSDYFQKYVLENLKTIDE